jgi:hypothetical protein
MGFGRVLLVWRAVTDVTVQNDERRPAFGLAEHLESALNSVHVIGIADAQHVPATGKEAPRHILSEGDVSIAFDGDVVVVENPAEVVEAQVAGERRSLRRDALH